MHIPDKTSLREFLRIKKVFSTSIRWKTRQEKGTCEKPVLGGKPDVRRQERKKTANVGSVEEKLD